MCENLCLKSNLLKPKSVLKRNCVRDGNGNKERCHFSIALTRKRPTEAPAVGAILSGSAFYCNVQPVIRPKKNLAIADEIE